VRSRPGAFATGIASPYTPASTLLASPTAGTEAAVLARWESEILYWGAMTTITSLRILRNPTRTRLGDDGLGTRFNGKGKGELRLRLRTIFFLPYDHFLSLYNIAVRYLARLRRWDGFLLSAQSVLPARAMNPAERRQEFSFLPIRRRLAGGLLPKGQFPHIAALCPFILVLHRV